MGYRSSIVLGNRVVTFGIEPFEFLLERKVPKDNKQELRRRDGGQLRRRDGGQLRRRDGGQLRRRDGGQLRRRDGGQLPRSGEELPLRRGEQLPKIQADQIGYQELSRRNSTIGIAVSDPQKMSQQQDIVSWSNTKPGQPPKQSQNKIGSGILGLPDIPEAKHARSPEKSPVGLDSLGQGEAKTSRRPVPSAAGQKQEIAEEAVFKDWSGRGQHVSFREDEQVPLEQGELLGNGSNAFVCKTICKGTVLAWKRQVYPPNTEPKTLKEKEILMRLDHKHIVKLVGTYKHPKPTGRLEFGLLTFPVAVCDLTAFLNDMDEYTSSSAPQSIDSLRTQRLQSLGFDLSQTAELVTTSLQNRTFQSIGCLTNALVYLHEMKIRHKDIKPANILLYRDNIRFTDFGNSTDFSNLSATATDNGGPRGSPRYFAPEAADWKNTGRSADIFSLGCVFLEMVHAVSTFSGLQRLKDLRPEAGRSYQANLSNLHQWTYITGASHDTAHLLCEIRSMLAETPKSRPTAGELNSRFTLIGQLYDSNTDAFHGTCCSSLAKFKQQSIAQQEKLQIEYRKRTDLEKMVSQLETENQSLRHDLEDYKSAAESLTLDCRKEGEEKKMFLKTAQEAEHRFADSQLEVERQRKELEASLVHVDNLQKTLQGFLKTSDENSRLKKDLANLEISFRDQEKQFEERLAEKRDEMQQELDLQRRNNQNLQSSLESARAQCHKNATQIRDMELEKKAAYQDRVEEKKRLKDELECASMDMVQAQSEGQELFDALKEVVQRFDAKYQNFDPRSSQISSQISRADSGYETGSPSGLMPELATLMESRLYTPPYP